MNKWQIICPLAAFAIVAVVFAMVSGSKHHRYYVQAQTHMLGQELIATTNSSRLGRLDSGLQKRLSEFLASPAHVAAVLLGDEPSPIGDGVASSRLILSNAAGERLAIRLRQGSGPEKFYVLNFWTVTSPTAEP